MLFSFLPLFHSPFFVLFSLSHIQYDDFVITSDSTLLTKQQPYCVALLFEQASYCLLLFFYSAAC